jgi:hypothetical protein
MEELMELVAATFVRNGIECPSSCGNGTQPRPSEANPSQTPGLIADALSEHNYRQLVQADPSP